MDQLLPSLEYPAARRRDSGSGASAIAADSFNAIHHGYQRCVDSHPRSIRNGRGAVFFCFGQQRRHRAYVHTMQTIAALTGGLLMMRVSTDDGIESAFGKCEQGCRVMMTANADTFAAEDTPVGKIHQAWMAGVDLRFFELEGVFFRF